MANGVNIAPSNYLLRDNLHLKPASARVCVSLWDSATYLASHVGDEEAGTDCIVKFLSEVVFISGSLVTAAIAIIEIVATIAIGAIGILLSFGIHCEFLEKFSLKALSYSVHTCCVLIASLYALIAIPVNKSYLANTLVDHLGYVGSAILVQCIGGRVFDYLFRAIEDDETSQQYILQRMAYIIAADFPYFAGDFVLAGLLDIQLHNLIPTMLNFFLNGVDQPVLQNPFLGALFPFLRTLGHFIEGEDGQQVFEINVGPEHLSPYQSHLQQYVEVSLIEIYRDDNLVSAFASDSIQEVEARVQSGRANLEAFDGAVFQGIVNWAELKELEDDMRCPAHFSNEERFAPFNNRLRQITAAKHLYSALSEDEKALLKDKLLRGAEYLPPDKEIDRSQAQKLHQVYLAVTQLSSSLLQGPLVTKTVLNIHNIAEGDGNHVLTPTNIFQTAFRKALAIVAPPQANQEERQ